MFRRFEITSSAENDVNYHKPEEESSDILRTLGPEVEMKTFKSNIPQVPRDEKGAYLLSIIHVGGAESTVSIHNMTISEYMRTGTALVHFSPLAGAKFCQRRIEWQTDDTDPEKKSRFLQFWETVVQRHISAMFRIFGQIQGAFIFWGPERSNSLGEALAWKDIIQKYSPSYNFPLILITDNPRNEQWIGLEKMFGSAEEMDEFCRENDFITWYELTSHDLPVEDSAYGRAIHHLVGEILDPKQGDCVTHPPDQ